MSPIRRNRDGFTLIELLVVIAIIAILAAILFPVFAQAREKARAASCLSNQKQIGLAVMQYYQDYDETYPVNNTTYFPQNAGNLTTTFLVSWMLQIEPYSKNVDIYSCPSRADDIASAVNYSGRVIRLPQRGIGANEWIVGRVGYTAHVSGGQPVDPIAEADLRRPADTAFAADCLFLLFNDPRRVAMANWFVPGSAWWAFPNSAANAVNPAYARHNGGSNVIFCDGHAKWRNQRAIADDPARSSQPFPNFYALPVNPKDLTNAAGTITNPIDNRLL